MLVAAAVAGGCGSGAGRTVTVQPTSAASPPAATRQSYLDQANAICDQNLRAFDGFTQKDPVTGKVGFESPGQLRALGAALTKTADALQSQVTPDPGDQPNFAKLITALSQTGSSAQAFAGPAHDRALFVIVIEQLLKTAHAASLDSCAFH